MFWAFNPHETGCIVATQVLGALLPLPLPDQLRELRLLPVMLCQAAMAMTSMRWHWKRLECSQLANRTHAHARAYTMKRFQHSAHPTHLPPNNLPGRVLVDSSSGSILCCLPFLCYTVPFSVALFPISFFVPAHFPFFPSTFPWSLTVCLLCLIYLMCRLFV